MTENMPRCYTVGDKKNYIILRPKIEKDDIEDIPDLNDLTNYSKLQLLIKKLGQYL